MTFRALRSLPALQLVEEMQRAVFAGITDLDLVSAGMLMGVPETGGEVIGAFVPGERGSELVGFVIGWGGFVDRRPRVLSDMLGVRSDHRGSGLGAELKRLQAAISVAAGFAEIVWTVDPLRAANARLNFAKLGAYADRYEIDRYGSGFAADLYGGMPTDRLHVTWPLRSATVRERLTNPAAPTGGDSGDSEDTAGSPIFDPTAGMVEAEVLVPMPADIDRLLARDPDSALAWRVSMRRALIAAFEQGYVVTGFAPSTVDRPDSALVLTRGRRPL